MSAKSLLFTCVAIGSLGLADAAMAADAAAGSTLEEVVVTARKRSENLQNVPISITAFNGDQLTERGITKATDLQTQVPSLSVASSAIFGDQPQWNIRGQRNDSFLLLQAPTVTTYFADVPQGHPAGFGLTLFDIGSVNVLKGPQGTLFGKNSTGGAVVVTPNHPTDRFEGELHGTLANYDTRIVGGVINLPMGDMFQVRVAGEVHRDDGLMKNLTTGGRLQQTDSEGVRVSLNFVPTSKISNLTILDWFHKKGTPPGARLIFVNPASFLGLPPFAATLNAAKAQYDYEQAQTGEDRWSAGSAWGTGSAADIFHRPLRTKLENYGLTNDTSVELTDSIKLRNILGIRRMRDAYDAEYAGGNYLISSSASIQSLHQTSDELQLLGKSFDGRLDWVIGGFYMKESGTEDVGAGNFLSRVELAGGGRTTSKSVFTQGTFSVTDDLRVTLGGRYNSDEVYGFTAGRRLAPTSPLEPKAARVAIACSEGAFNTTTNTVVPFALGPGCIIEGTKTFREPTYTASVEYGLHPEWLAALDKGLVYFTTRKGYRQGGFNMRATYSGTFGPYQPEIAKDYEVGFKGDWTLGEVRLRTNLAFYYEKFTDLQRSANVAIAPNPVPQQTIVNAASAHVKGAEFEWVLIPTSNLEFSGFYSLTDAKYDKYLSLSPAGAPLDLSGRPFVSTPKNKYALQARYHQALGGDNGQIVGTVNYSWQSATVLAEVNMANGVSPMQDAYGLWNLRLDWKAVGGKSFDAGIWVRNAGGQYYYSGIADLSASLGVAASVPGEPRTVGLDLRYHF